MDPATIGLIGGVGGTVIGFLGGAIGTWFSIKNTNGPLAKKLMIQMSLIFWMIVFTFLGLMFLLPVPYKHLLWIPYGIGLPVAIRYCNRKQQEIRETEARV